MQPSASLPEVGISAIKKTSVAQRMTPKEKGSKGSASTTTFSQISEKKSQVVVQDCTSEVQQHAEI
jgi:hypothetical protein